MKRVLLGAVVMATMLPAGCVLPRQSIENGPQSPTFQVKCAGECVELDRKARSIDPALLAKVDELLKYERHASISNLVERNIEDAVACLRQRDGKATPCAAELAVARALDRLMEYPSGDGWVEYARHQKHGSIAAAEDALRTAQTQAKTKNWNQVASILARNETILLRSAYHGVLANLLRSEALRHLGKNNEAAGSWQNAVVQATTLRFGTHMPALWEKIAGQRPVSAAWPSETFALARPLPESLHVTVKSSEFTPELLAWFSIGNARLERGEAAEALTAFKRADTMGRFADWDDFLMLYQSKALLAMQQTPAATGLLTALIERPNRSRWHAAALALLGAGKLNDGHVDQAIAFLREATSGTHANNPWQADSMANLGLAYLMTGNEAKGIESLRGAQRGFLQVREGAGLLLCLENEASYWQNANRTNEHQAVRGRIQELETQAK